ncbi:MAG: 4-(cytidine 5'-diphospho)-2-C-methyl-D-erythritol kinase [Patescibacteria group bacterium]
MQIISCPAKLNLFLAIGKKIGDYHEIETVMMRAPKLEDFLHIEESEKLKFECKEMPENNSVMKAIDLLEKKTGKKFNYKIRLEKNIPPRSGLGGGSSDAASILVFLNQKENLGLAHVELMEMGAQIGMDLPFFISGHELALATHYGEKIKALKRLPKDFDYEIHFTGNEISTKDAYEKITKISQKFPQKILEAIEQSNTKKILENLHNDFESITPLSYQSNASEKALLTGSGGAFAVFREKNTHK